MSVAAVLALVLLAAACQLPGPTPAAPTPTATATDGRPAATPRDSTPQASGALAGLPVVPGATRKAPPAGDAGVVAGWTTADEGPAVYDFYEAALPAAGFPITELLPGGEVAVIRFVSREGEAMELLITLAAGETRILLRRGGQEP